MQQGWVQTTSLPGTWGPLWSSLRALFSLSVTPGQSHGAIRHKGLFLAQRSISEDAFLQAGESFLCETFVFKPSSSGFPNPASSPGRCALPWRSQAPRSSLLFGTPPPSPSLLVVSPPGLINSRISLGQDYYPPLNSGETET